MNIFFFTFKYSVAKQFYPYIFKSYKKTLSPRPAGSIPSSNKSYNGFGVDMKVIHTHPSSHFFFYYSGLKTLLAWTMSKKTAPMINTPPQNPTTPVIIDCKKMIRFYTYLLINTHYEISA